MILVFNFNNITYLDIIAQLSIFLPIYIIRFHDVYAVRKNTDFSHTTRLDVLRRLTKLRGSDPPIGFFLCSLMYYNNVKKSNLTTVFSILFPPPPIWQTTYSCHSSAIPLLTYLLRHGCRWRFVTTRSVKRTNVNPPHYDRSIPTDSGAGSSDTPPPTSYERDFGDWLSFTIATIAVRYCGSRARASE